MELRGSGPVFGAEALDRRFSKGEFCFGFFFRHGETGFPHLGKRFTDASSSFVSLFTFVSFFKKKIYML